MPAPPSPANTAGRVVFASAPGCAECKRQAPVIEDVARRHPGVAFERIDASVYPERVRELGVMATPTVIAFTGDREITRLVGRRGPEDLEGLFASVEVGGEFRGGDANVRLWVGTGLLMGTLGLLAGPAWPLVGFGVAISGYGVVASIASRT